ncbi:MAG: hypothetical protein LC109_11615 [Bacteroidia bacterium]|nr:hypothetical protein [Bacteroidia bacterium]MCO5254801.1 hypothetical protein [Bacteroidota bacterium]MCZ2130893.1 hypothetical protein [Bacteroidia bacterium]
MTPARLTDILNNPNSVSDKEIATLETLVAEFPYYNLPHILLAKIYKEKEDYKYDKQVKKASLRVIDRAWLFSFIQSAQPLSITEQPISEEDKTEILTNKPENQKELPSIDTLVPQTLHENIESESEITAPEETPTIEHVEQVSRTNTSDNIIETGEIESEQTISKTCKQQDKWDEQDETVENAEEIELLQPIIETQTTEFHSFSDWLNQFSKPIKDATESILTTDSTPTTSPPPSHSEIKSNHSDSIALIDSFLKNQPSISHPKTDFFKAEKAAIKSLELDDDIVTETLASIYVKQGHIPEAIWAYEKLKLKFPQKESYFAALIKELKKDTE